MKKTLLLIAALFCALTTFAQKVKFAYDASLDCYFDNREYSASHEAFTRSMTIFGARLTPEIGFSAHSGGEQRGADHRLMAGVNMMKTFGSSQKPTGIFEAITLYYQLKTNISPKCEFELNAGIFPRTRSRGYFNEIFFSDSVRFYKPNYEGVQFSFRRPKSYYEVGVNWMGEYGTDAQTREKFQIYGSAEGEVKQWLKIGASVAMLHFANSREARGLVDNILADLWADFDFGKLVGIQRLSVMLEYMQGAQQDRVYIHKYTFPMGGRLNLEVRNWNAGLRNQLYLGYSLMPYYNNIDAIGNKYGSNLYLGDPFYRVSPDLSAALDPYRHTLDCPEGETHQRGTAGIYDCLEAYYQPRIARGLHLRVGAKFHFTSKGYAGCSQVLAIRFSLWELMTQGRDF